MPRPNQPRSIASEQALARRVAFERVKRGMSYEGLALRMAKVGCPIQPSAIYKIEKLDPPRRITVDELVAFAQVFGEPVERLLLPPELVAAEDLTALVVAWNRAQDQALSARQEEDEAWERIRTWVEQHPEHADKIEPVLRYWSELHFEDDDLGHNFRAAAKAWDLTHDAAVGERAKELLDVLVQKEAGRGQHQEA